ncbi:MAG: hypothetical protein R3327_03755 [Nitrosopumilaceae archaeon]|nr:hypothetical protein [Nitrosopumilaceae archaeon]
MNKWIFWAGIAFLIGGFLSLSINSSLGPPFYDDIGYSIGWIATGVVLVAVSVVYERISKK